MINFINRDFITLFLCLFFSLFLYFSSESKITSSVKSEISDSLSWIGYPQKWYSDLLSANEKRKLLSEKLAIMNMQNAKLLKFENENQELKILLDYKNEQPLSLVLGKIVKDNFTYLKRTITINVGKKDSLLVNLPVIDVNGLVGKTIAVGDRASQVQLITDKNFRVSIRIGDDQTIGEFIPKHKDLGIIDGIEKTASISIGDIVYTSGISTIYPEGIKLAKVVSINKDNENAFQDIDVEILADLDNYNFVFVIL